jgi:hypothetical protein
MMSCKLFHMPYYISEYVFRFLKFWAKFTLKKGFLWPLWSLHIEIVACTPWSKVIPTWVFPRLNRLIKVTVHKSLLKKWRKFQYCTDFWNRIRKCEHYETEIPFSHGEFKFCLFFYVLNNYIFFFKRIHYWTSRFPAEITFKFLFVIALREIW